MSNQDKYGNLPLGQVTKLLVSVIGQDAALAIAEKKGIPVFQKDLDRLYLEKESSFSLFRPSKEDGVVELSRQFFEMLEKEYDFPYIVGSLAICDFFRYYRSALKALNTYDKHQKKLALTLLNGFLGFLGIEHPDKKGHPIHIDILKIAVSRLLSETYDLIFKDLISRSAKNDSDFYVHLPADHDFKQVIQRCRKTNSNMTWKMFKPLLDFIYAKGEKEIVHRLLGLYLLKNVESALEEVCGISKKEQYQIKEELRRWAKDELPSKPQNETQAFLLASGHYNSTDFSSLQRFFIDPDYQEEKKSIETCMRYLYQSPEPINPSRIERFITEMEEKCPHCKALFSPWFRARAAILSSYQFDSDKNEIILNALEDYHKAFEEGRTYAGGYLKMFLEEIIAVSVYFERRETKDIPKVIDSDKSLKAPITNDAKRYYEYGYALNMFEQESWDTFLLHFRAREHFWKVFPVSKFFHAKTAEQKSSEDFLKAMGMVSVEGDVENFEERDKTIKKNLENITEKTINRRMDRFPGYKHDIQYTPLSIALQRGELDIAERHLKDFTDSLDETVINTHGSTALEEALTQYKQCRLSGNKDQEFLSKVERYKKIIMELIKRSPADSLYAETVKKHISVLEEAINAFDLDIVKAIVEKKNFDIQNLKISADELSPLYYAVMRLKMLDDIVTGRFNPMGGNINLAKLDVPGIFSEDKHTYFENMQANPLFQMILEPSLNLFVGAPDIREHHSAELKKIVQYLIEKTKNVDAFVDKLNRNVLSLAVESNFDDICRLLIEKVANPAYVFCANGKPSDAALFRAAYFKSYKTLEMLLTDYKDRIGSVINERFGEHKQTPAHLLFRVGNDIMYSYIVNQDNFRFIEKFIPLFRNAGANFNIPDFQDITVKQVLKRHNLDYLIEE